MIKKLPNAPVFFDALAQVQFNPVTAIANYIMKCRTNFVSRDIQFLNRKKLTSSVLKLGQMLHTQGLN